MNLFGYLPPEGTLVVWQVGVGGLGLGVLGEGAEVAHDVASDRPSMSKMSAGSGQCRWTYATSPGLQVRHRRLLGQDEARVVSGHAPLLLFRGAHSSPRLVVTAPARGHEGLG